MQREKKIENLSNINQKTKILILKKKNILMFSEHIFSFVRSMLFVMIIFLKTKK